MNKNNIDLLIKLGMFGGFAVVVWLILRRLGLTQTRLEREGNINIAETFTKIEVEEQKQRATLTESELRAIAAKIKNAWGFFNDDEEAVYNAFSRLNNYDDLMLMIRYYGINKKNGLEDDITDKMGEREVQKINDILAKKNINFNF